MRDQHALHRGLTSHFKIPKKPALKSSMQSRPSVHQFQGLSRSEAPISRSSQTHPPMDGGPQYQWPVVQSSTSEPHQYFGNGSCLLCRLWFPQQVAWIGGPLVTTLQWCCISSRKASFRPTRLMIRVLKFCDRKGIVRVHLPGCCNMQADSLSRPGQTLLTKWEIHPDLLQLVFNRWGQQWIDLFATFQQQEMPSVHISISGPVGSLNQHTVDPVEPDGHVYAFPQFKIIPKVIAKLRQSESITMNS